MGAVIIIAPPLSCQCARQQNKRGAFGSPDQKLWPLIMKQKEKPKHCAKSTRNVPKRKTSGECK